MEASASGVRVRVNTTGDPVLREQWQQRRSGSKKVLWLLIAPVVLAILPLVQVIAEDGATFVLAVILVTLILTGGLTWVQLTRKRRQVLRHGPLWASADVYYLGPAGAAAIDGFEGLIGHFAGRTLMTMGRLAVGPRSLAFVRDGDSHQPLVLSMGDIRRIDIDPDRRNGGVRVSLKDGGVAMVTLPRKWRGLVDAMRMLGATIEDFE